MKKILNILIVLLIMPMMVFAASGSIKASTSSSKVTIGNTFTVTVKVSSTDKLGSWEYGLSYDKSKLSLVSGDPKIKSYGDGTFSSKSYTYKFKAIALGNASITIDSPRIIDWDSESAISTTAGNLTITVKEVVVVNLSSDNNLKSLSVEGFELSPEFSKSELKYNVKTNASTTKVKITAQANDSKAKVSGTGEVEVKEGANEFEVVVTAENGSKKTYQIIVTVPEKDPINYKFGDAEYSILRKLPANVPVGFNNNTIKFNDEEVPCLQNQKLGLTLLYLRNSKNDEAFYVYNESSNSIEVFSSIANNDEFIYLTNDIKPIEGMIKSTVNIEGNRFTAYKIQENSNDYFISGRNISTGVTSIYRYDKENKSISLFNKSDFDLLLKSNDIFKYVSYALSGALVFLVLILVIVLNNVRKMNFLLKRFETEKNVKVEEKKEEKKDKNNKKKIDKDEE